MALEGQGMALVKTSLTCTDDRKHPSECGIKLPLDKHMVKAGSVT